MHFFTPELEDYINNHTSPEDEVLTRLWRETHIKTMMPQMLSGTNQGRFLQMMVQLCRPKVALELGTFTGYGSICIARGLPEVGMLHTAEVNDELGIFHKKYFAEAGLEHKIKVHYKNGLDVIAAMNEPIDFAFIDADKENYVNYYESLVPNLRKGGLLLVDNVLWSGKVVDPEANDVETTIIRQLNDRVHADVRVDHVLVPMRDGMMVIIKK
jgi:predicted O-methyltransferase YrrM